MLLMLALVARLASTVGLVVNVCCRVDAAEVVGVGMDGALGTDDAVMGGGSGAVNMRALRSAMRPVDQPEPRVPGVTVI